MEEPRLVELPGYRVVKLRYEGPPPDRGFVEHWKRFNALAERLSVRSCVDDIQAIGYAPPGVAASRVFVYDTCIPVAPDFSPNENAKLELGGVPGGRFVLCAGMITELPSLLQAAKRYATAYGLAFERGQIELYHPISEDEEVARVDVGVRIHD